MALAEIGGGADDVERQEIDAVVDGDGDAIEIENGLTAVENEVEMDPLVHRERSACFEHTVVGGNVGRQRALGQPRRIKRSEEKPAVVVLAEIEDTLPGAAAAPVNPAGDGLGIGGARGEADVLARAG